jgi:hypothetical protein
LSEVERNLFLIRHMGLPDMGMHLEFPITEDDAIGLKAAGALTGLRPGSYVCLHPGASVREKCWPTEKFAVVGRFLREMGFAVVITGNRSEAELAAQIAREMGSGCIDSASLDLSLGSLALLIRGARLLVCNDTGVSHLASAIRVSSVVVFTRADPVRWAPLERRRHRSVGGPGEIPDVVAVLSEVKNLLSQKEQ